MDRDAITSRDNRRLVTARKVREGRMRELIFIEGKRLAIEALRSRIEIEECFVEEGFADRDLAEAAAKRAKTASELSEKLFRSVADTKESQGIILVAKRPDTGRNLITLSPDALPLVVFLHQTNNPSNLGAVVRTCEAAGVAGVITSRGSTDVFSAKAVRAAMGASLRSAIWDNAETDEVFAWARENDLTTCAADSRAGKSYTEVDWTQPRLLVLGSEAHGLEDGEIMRVDETLSIPMRATVESLNLAVAAGVIFYEARRQNAAG